jgi:hypothetical protein
MNSNAMSRTGQRTRWITTRVGSQVDPHEMQSLPIIRPASETDHLEGNIQSPAHRKYDDSLATIRRPIVSLSLACADSSTSESVNYNQLVR